MTSISLTQSLGLEAKQFIQRAAQEQDLFKMHLGSRFLLLGTALVGTTEVVARLAFFLLGQVGALLTLYRSESLNDFLKEQIKFGFAASIITSASCFSLLAPSFFTSLQLPCEIPLPEENHGQAFSVQRDPIENAITQAIVNIVLLPFQMTAFFFKLPFYLIYLQFQIIFLPIRIAMLPFEITAAVFRRALPSEAHLGLI